MQNVLPRHVKAAATSTNSCAIGLLAHDFSHEVTKIPLCVENQHRRPAWLHYGGLKPTYLVLVQNVSSVSPEVVIAQDHRGHRGLLCKEMLLATGTKWYAATMAQFKVFVCDAVL
jgi:hypothetical protein